MSIVNEVAGLLLNWDHILILSHASPDGDTLGSASGLMRSLISLGKKVRFKCADEPGKKYAYLFEGIPSWDFEPEHIVAVDVADPLLLGSLCGEYRDKVDVVIDHHGTHVQFGRVEWVDSSASANCQMIYELAVAMKVKMDSKIADCLYTGLCTDTGCFMYASVTSKTLRIGAELIDLGANSAEINRAMFNTKTRACIEVERKVLKDMEFYHNDKIALIALPKDLIEKTGARESDLEGLPSIPRSIEGVLLGVTLKERENGIWKASVRADMSADASAICSRFGGGGHRGAAGCSFNSSFEEAKKKLVEGCEAYLDENGL